MPAQLRLGLGQHLGLQGFAVRCAVADDEGHQALRAAELSTVEDELRRRIGRGAQRQPGRARGQCVGGVNGLRIDGGNGAVLQVLGQLRPALQGYAVACRQAVVLGSGECQARRLGRGAGQQHGVEGRVFALGCAQRPVRALGLQFGHAAAQAHGVAALLQPLRGRRGEQAAQVTARHQEMRAATAAEQRIAQHAKEHRAAGQVNGCVERRDAQRVDELADQALRQAGAQVGHGGLRRAAKARQPPAHGTRQQGCTLAQAPAACGGNAGQRIQRRRPVGKAQAAAIGVGQGHGLAVQRPFRVHAHLAHEAQAFGVGTDEDVLAVVHAQRALWRVEVHAARTAAGLACGLVQGDVPAAARQRKGGREAGPAAAEDGGARLSGARHRGARLVFGAVSAHRAMRPSACIFQASHSLRSGGRLMRWCSTRKSSASISRSRVR